MRGAWLWLLIAVALFWAEKETNVVTKAVQSVLNGRLVGPRTARDARGIIPTAPATLAAQAGLDVETYSLARMVSSEHGQDPDVYCEAIAFAVRNKAREKGQTLLTLLTARKSATLNGFYGEQKTEPIAYAATVKDPYERHVRIVQKVLGGAPDITGGATHFFSPRAQRATNKRDPARNKPPEAVHTKWTSPGGLYAKGAVRVDVPGIDNDRLSLYRRVA